MKRSFRLTLVVVALLLFFGAPTLVSFYVDWLWFGELGYQPVFTTTLAARGNLAVAVFLLAFLALFLNLRGAFRTLSDRPSVTWTTREGLKIRSPDRRELASVARIAATGLAVLMAVYASSQWELWLTYVNRVPFGIRDAILGRDVGFYVFELPFLHFVRRILTWLVVLSAAGAGAIYVLAGALSIASGGRWYASGAARRHLSLLAAAFLLLLAFGAYLEIPDELLERSGIIYGASYTDVYARLPALRILAVAGVVSAGLAVFHAFGRGWWPLPVGAALYVVVALGGQVYESAIQRLVVAPNEQANESPYITHNIQATRAAFDIEKVEERELSGDATLTRADIDRNAETLQNVRLWDHQPLLDTFGQLQEIRTYYDFVSVDNDRYTINGRYRQIMLSARELNSNSLPNRTWVNEHMVFTHGYGITLGPVNEVVQEGLPLLFIRDLPPQSTVDLQVEEPSIYFGELDNDYVFVGTAAKEFHYPKGDDNVYATYTGSGGVPVSSFLRKLMLSLRFGSYQILLSNDINNQSRVIFNRRLQDRVNAIAPFLIYDQDPYLVVADGRLVWIQDAYTATNRYPYSTPASNGVNYIRNSVKITIDAYHGTTNFYIADASDPILTTYARIFPSLFRPLDQMPATLRRHVRYPEGLFGIQTEMYSTYHMTNPAVFYNKEDQWEVPVAAGTTNGEEEAMVPYYTMMKVPGSDAAEFIQMLPFTPRRKDNLAAWMIARSDGAHYGTLAVFQFPKQKVVFGPRQVVARISQDQAISPQITLWNQQGSQVIMGTLLVIPVEESLLYVQPLYLRSTGGRIPELKRVIVAHQNDIVMETTLEAALQRLFPSGQPRPASPPPPQTTQEPATPPGPERDTQSMQELAATARIHYEAAIAAQRKGDWAAYGEELRKLGETLERMKGR